MTASSDNAAAPRTAVLEPAAVCAVMRGYSHLDLNIWVFHIAPCSSPPRLASGTRPLWALGAVRVEPRLALFFSSFVFRSSPLYLIMYTDSATARRALGFEH